MDWTGDTGRARSFLDQAAQHASARAADVGQRFLPGVTLADATRQGGHLGNQEPVFLLFDQ
jgi:hypothetical protein